MTPNRRWFLKSAAALSAAFSTASSSLASGPNPRRSLRADLGGLRPDPDGLLDLPAGFEYQVLSRTGDEMSDGLLVPGGPDGMAAFADLGAEAGGGGLTRIVRNHELMPGNPSAFGAGDERGAKVPEQKFYDRGRGVLCPGGTTTLVYDTGSRSLKKQFLSLAGTARNCAGGPTPWGSWITCEEATFLRGGEYDQNHGYCFEVDAAADAPVDPIPLVAMGRFNHEAVAIDAASGTVFLTEDRPDSLLYRFLPDEPGNLAAGGILQALRIRRAPMVDTRNWNEYSHFPLNEQIEVDWVDLDNVEAPEDDLRERGFLKGAARFARGEGMWAGDGAIWFACTSGGRKQCGQVFCYRPSPDEGQRNERRQRGTLELYLESPHPRLLDFCDNLTVAPWGDLVLCEDGAGDNFIVGVGPKGDIYPLARNAGAPSEFAGATFSPDGKALFVNLQWPGTTVAIFGPWPSA